MASALSLPRATLRRLPRSTPIREPTASQARPLRLPPCELTLLCLRIRKTVLQSVPAESQAVAIRAHLAICRIDTVCLLAHEVGAVFAHPRHQATLAEPEAASIALDEAASATVIKHPVYLAIRAALDGVLFHGAPAALLDWLRFFQHTGASLVVFAGLAQVLWTVTYDAGGEVAELAGEDSTVRVGLVVLEHEAVGAVTLAALRRAVGMGDATGRAPVLACLLEAMLDLHLMPALRSAEDSSADCASCGHTSRPYALSPTA
ncbi:hypothetical protein LTR53_009507 [Teratosphaeriaceae sp. CCFEE 6253]|nr:hypothetical protein LTR53_009507 [Teratosphaeriaceae sp. CCFEE 6253]